MGQPAVWWADQVTWARKCQAQAEAFALAVNDTVDNPRDPYAAELRRDRYRAARAEVEAWEQYARQAEAAFQSAAEAEMAEADGTERAARRSRYDDSFAVLHANGKCRSGFCCAQDTA